MNKQLIHQNARIEYRVEGKGKVVFLVHGFGETGDVWENQLPILSEKYTVIIPDLPGSGLSDPIGDMSMEGLAEVIKKIWSSESADPASPAFEQPTFTLFGHSMGGYITLAFVEKYASLLNGFGLIHSACFADSEEKKETRKKGIAFIREHGAFAFLESTSPNLFSPETKKDNPELIKDFLSTLSRLPPASLISYYEAMMARPDRSNVLQTTSLPVLFVLGEFDTAIPIKDGLRQTTFPELSYIHVLEHSGHMGMLEEKENLNRHLVAYLTDI